MDLQPSSGGKNAHSLFMLWKQKTITHLPRAPLTWNRDLPNLLIMDKNSSWKHAATPHPPTPATQSRDFSTAFRSGEN